MAYVLDYFLGMSFNLLESLLVAWQLLRIEIPFMTVGLECVDYTPHQQRTSTSACPCLSPLTATQMHTV